MTLSSIFHKPPKAFVVRRGAGVAAKKDDDDDDDDSDDDNDNNLYEDENDVGGGSGGVDLLDMGVWALVEAIWVVVWPTTGYVIL
jgi:hypothetical protein